MALGDLMLNPDGSLTLDSAGNLMLAPTQQEFEDCCCGGCWLLMPCVHSVPLYPSGGIFSMYPNTPWVGSSIANNGTHELRNVGFFLVPPATLLESQSGCTFSVQNTSTITITADTNCTVGIYACPDGPIDFTGDPPTWNKYDPSAGLGWSSGAGDGGTLLGSLTLVAGVPNSISGAGVAAALQAMLMSTAYPHIMVRRSNAGYETIGITGNIKMVFGNASACTPTGFLQSADSELASYLGKTVKVTSGAGTFCYKTVCRATACETEPIWNVGSPASNVLYIDDTITVAGEYADCVECCNS